MLVFQIVKLFL
jgi:hypothetical protein